MTPPTVRRILLAIEYDRLTIIRRFRAAGGDLDKWRKRDWELMARELTAEEDRIEEERETPAREAKREDLRCLRRGLEDAYDAC